MAQTGVVKFFNGERGYGFIKPDDGGRDVFVHITAVEQAGLKSLNEGQKISFDVEPDKKGKGPKAVNLVVTCPASYPRSRWPPPISTIPRTACAHRIRLGKFPC